MSFTRRTRLRGRVQGLRGSGLLVAITLAGACGGMQTEGAGGKDAGADAGGGSLGPTDAGAADRASADNAAEVPSVPVRLTIINACSLTERTGETITVPPVTVLLDNQPLVEELPFGAATSAIAITVRPQRSRIEARAGRSQSPPRVIDTDIENDDEITVVLSGSDCRPLLLGDEFGETAPDAVRVRFVDASTIGQQAPARLLAWNADIGEWEQLTAAPLRGASPPAGNLM